jgi:signal peptidase II
MDPETRSGRRQYVGKEGTMTHRRIGLILAALVFAIDQFAKYMVAVPFDLKNRGQIVINPIFNLTWVENYGVSLGLLTADGNSGRWLLVALTGAIAMGVSVWLWRERNRQDVYGLGLILGGALGNIVDRVRFGHVVDFADLHFGEFRPFLVFNVADAAITIGVLILLFRALLVREPKKVI